MSDDKNDYYSKDESYFIGGCADSIAIFFTALIIAATWELLLAGGLFSVGFDKFFGEKTADKLGQLAEKFYNNILRAPGKIIGIGLVHTKRGLVGAVKYIVKSNSKLPQKEINKEINQEIQLSSMKPSEEVTIENPLKNSIKLSQVKEISLDQIDKMAPSKNESNNEITISKEKFNAIKQRLEGKFENKLQETVKEKYQDSVAKYEEQNPVNQGPDAKHDSPTIGKP